jgi:hypothetical protein
MLFDLLAYYRQSNAEAGQCEAFHVDSVDKYQHYQAERHWNEVECTNVQCCHHEASNWSFGSIQMQFVVLLNNCDADVAICFDLSRTVALRLDPLDIDSAASSLRHRNAESCCGVVSHWHVATIQSRNHYLQNCQSDWIHEA